MATGVENRVVFSFQVQLLFLQALGYPVGLVVPSVLPASQPEQLQPAGSAPSGDLAIGIRHAVKMLPAV